MEFSSFIYKITLSIKGINGARIRKGRAIIRPVISPETPSCYIRTGTTIYGMENPAVVPNRTQQ